MHIVLLSIVTPFLFFGQKLRSYFEPKNPIELPPSSPSATCGWGQPVDPLDPTGELSVHFPDYPEGSPYWVLDTDYETYASGYACTNITLNGPGEAWQLRRQSAWIITRDRISTQETVRNYEIVQ